MPNIPEANTTNCRAYDESMYGREEPTKRGRNARVITWKYCENCEDMTLHSFKDGVGECLKCGENLTDEEDEEPEMVSPARSIFLDD